jgi:hypothetical protein
MSRELDIGAGRRPRRMARAAGGLVAAALLVLAATPAAAQLNLSTPGATDYGELPPPGATDGRPPRPDAAPLEGPAIGSAPPEGTAAERDGGFSFTIEGGGPTGSGGFGADPTAPPGQLDLFDPDARDRVRCQDARWRSLNPSACGGDRSFELQWQSQ